MNEINDEITDGYIVCDNPKNGFIVPDCLGRKTVMLKDDDRNIYKQEAVSVENLLHITITSIEEVLDLVK